MLTPAEQALKDAAEYLVMYLGNVADTRREYAAGQTEAHTAHAVEDGLRSAVGDLETAIYAAGLNRK